MALKIYLICHCEEWNDEAVSRYQIVIMED